MMRSQMSKVCLVSTKSSWDVSYEIETRAEECFRIYVSAVQLGEFCVAATYAQSHFSLSSVSLRMLFAVFQTQIPSPHAAFYLACVPSNGFSICFSLMLRQLG